MPVFVAAIAVGALLLSGALFGDVPLLSVSPRPAHAFGLETTTESVPAAESGAESGFEPYWVVAYSPITLWSNPTFDALSFGDVHQWSAFYVVRPASEGRLYVWNPISENYAWIDEVSVGPVDPSKSGNGDLPPIGRQIAWTGAARVTMYTCVELGGCNATASGLWPEIGMVAVDPRVIPLGSTIWIQGLGTFLAADTGSLVRGAHIDVYSESYADAIQWGVQSLPVVVFAPG